jgi:hypothetical protein
VEETQARPAVPTRPVISTPAPVYEAAPVDPTALSAPEQAAANRLTSAQAAHTQADKAVTGAEEKLTRELKAADPPLSPDATQARTKEFWAAPENKDLKEKNTTATRALADTLKTDGPTLEGAAAHNPQVADAVVKGNAVLAGQPAHAQQALDFAERATRDASSPLGTALAPAAKDVDVLVGKAGSSLAQKLAADGKTPAQVHAAVKTQMERFDGANNVLNTGLDAAGRTARQEAAAAIQWTSQGNAFGVRKLGGMVGHLNPRERTLAGTSLAAGAQAENRDVKTGAFALNVGALAASSKEARALVPANLLTPPAPAPANTSAPSAAATPAAAEDPLARFLAILSRLRAGR